MKRVLLLVVIIIIWQLLYQYSDILKRTYMPSPSQIILIFIESIANREISLHIISSIKRVIIGFIMASITGVSLGILLGYFKKISYYCVPIIEVLKSIPPIAWIPLAIILFGLGDRPSYFIVFLGAFFPIFLNTYIGVVSLPVIYKNIAKSFEISGIKYIWNILFKYSLSYIFAGLRIGIGTAWMSVIAAELIGAQSGLGYYIEINRLLLKTDHIIMGMLLIGFIGYSLSELIYQIEKSIIKWEIC